MYKLRPTSRFRKDVKLAEKRGYNIGLLTDVIKKLAGGETLGKSYSDHPLKGAYKGCRECHIASDWLLIYEVNGDALILRLMRTGTHSDLFE